MAFLDRNIYFPPGVYTRTLFESPLAGVLAGLKIPVIIGTGNEILFNNNQELIRGSSSTVDQQVVSEDETGRAVVSVLLSGEVVLGAFDGVLTRFQVRNLPIVDGSGSGLATTSTTAVGVTIDGIPIVVVGVDGVNGIVELAQAPDAGSEVLCTYFFNRTDTLILDDVSDQVTGDPALIRGVVAETYQITAGVNDTFTVTADSVQASIVIPEGIWTADQIAVFINGGAPGSLIASAFTNNLGLEAVQLVADQSLAIGDGTANGALGFTEGASTSRNQVFFTFQKPIVDGSNGGLTTTDPADVTVKVNNVQVIPTAVDGGNGAVTLPFAPASGSLVTIQYFFNTWQDTFDFLPNVGVLEILRAGVTADRNDFIDGVDFVLKDDKLVWGTAALVSSGVSTAGGTVFGETQVSVTLVDNRTFLDEATSVVDSSVIPPVDTRLVWQLPLQPTTGNGRGSPLGDDLFQTVSNSRIDLPTNRPDLVDAYWGFSVQDALDRGVQELTQVDSATSQITFQNQVPAGARVFATFFYSTMEDNEYTLTVVNPGPSGVGTYTIADRNDNPKHGVVFGTKSAGLTGISINFPSGSELLPDARHEGGTGGAVDEVVTVTFAQQDATPAKFTVSGNDPYAFISNASDHARVQIDATDPAVVTAAGIDLSNPAAIAGIEGFFASMMGNEVDYDDATGDQSWTIDATNNALNVQVDGVLVESSVTPGAGLTVADYVTALNTASALVPPRYTAATRFNSAVTITVGEYDALDFDYTGDVSAASGPTTATIAPGTYASASALATAVQASLAIATGALGAPFVGLTINVTADSESRLRFELVRATGDAQGYLEFITGVAAVDFAVLAGIDTDSAAGGAQTKLCEVEVARQFTVAGASGALKHDRIILRSRLMPGASSLQPFHQEGQTELLVQGSSGATKLGLETGQVGFAGHTATVKEPTLFGAVGFAGGQATGFADERDSQPAITFFAAGGVQSQNNVFRFTFDGTTIVVTFTDATGTAIPAGGSASVPLGPGSGSADTVLDQIATAMFNAGFEASAVAVLAARLVFQEGAGIRFTSQTVDGSGGITINDGNANGVLGFSEGQTAGRGLVDAKQVASALMAHSHTLLSDKMFLFGTPETDFFAELGLATVVTDSVNAEYLFLQSQTLGVASSVVIAESTADDWTLYGTGLDVLPGEGELGEDGISGFYVTSSDSVDGSGTADTSVLNSGTGQDGTVGKTYRDTITGLTFSVLFREGGLDYPAGSSFTLVAASTIATDATFPNNAIPGVALTVNNTTGVVPGDTSIVETFRRTGAEPAVGDIYVVSYSFTKQDFSTRLFTKLSVVEAEYGSVSTENPVSLAAFLAFINGAVLVGINQVPKAAGSSLASVTSFRDAVDDLTQPLAGGLNPDILIPLRGDSLDFFQFLSVHVDKMSSPRFKGERTAILGLTAGSAEEVATTFSQNLASKRMRLMYPDLVTVTLTDELNNSVETLADGFYLAAAMAGTVVSPNFDVASPWTRRQLFGFTQLGRKLNIVQQNQVAQAGVTVIEEQLPILRVRQGLTTDMTNVLTKTPTIIQIADEVQQRARGSLDRFIGQKFLAGLLPQVEKQLASMYKQMVNEQIVAAYTGIAANVDPEDPTALEIESFYAPIFPLLFIFATFNLRASL